MASVEAARERRNKAGAWVYILHNASLSAADVHFIPLPAPGASTVVLTVLGDAPDLTPQVSFDTVDWFQLVAFGKITAPGAYVFDTTGWLFFGLDVGENCLCVAKATATPASSPSAGVVSAAGIHTADLRTLLDEVSATTLYVGQAVLGSLASAAVWRIRRITTSGTVTTVSYADGDANFDNVWDNRASLTYS